MFPAKLGSSKHKIDRCHIPISRIFTACDRFPLFILPKEGILCIDKCLCILTIAVAVLLINPHFFLESIYKINQFIKILAAAPVN